MTSRTTSHNFITPVRHITAITSKDKRDFSASGSADISKSPIRNEGLSMQNFSTLAPYGVTTN